MFIFFMSVEVKEKEMIMLELKAIGDMKVKVVRVDNNVLDVGDSLEVEYAGGPEEDLGLTMELEVVEVFEEHVETEVRDITGSDILDEGHKVKITY